jgi:hypothetical protein
MSVMEREARSFTKNAEDAPALGIALPVRKRSPVDFWMSLYQLMPPMNVKLGFLVQKAAETNVPDGKLPAAARNELIRRALQKGMSALFFLDDDVLFPDLTLNRMWISMQKHPGIACITAVGPTKLTPSEPLIYQEGVQGAWWDWHLGALVEIHSAWAGCMLVNLDYVRKLRDPWFNDVVTDAPEDGGHHKRNIWGQDRYFHRKLREHAGGLVMADTGLLVAHYDADLQKAYILPPDAPCFRKPILGEAFVTFIDKDTGYVNWRRIVQPDQPDLEFLSYLDWLKDRTPQAAPITLVPEPEPVASNGVATLLEAPSVPDSDGLAAWFHAVALEKVGA